MELHWLPLEQRAEFKILLFTYKVVNGMAPVYLQDRLDLYRPCRSLRSGNMQLLKTQSYNLKSYGCIYIQVYIYIYIPIKTEKNDTFHLP